MSLALSGERTVISRLRIRGGTGDALQAGLRASTLLASASFSPPGMSPASVLIVRKFSDPRPGKLTLSGAMRLANDWEQAVRARMAVVAQRAQRPARSAVSADAEAVLFADEAELAACLVRDWLGDRVAGRWWWRGVLGDSSPRQWLARHVLARGEVMVPVISMLAPGDTLAWIARLSDEEARQAFAAVERSHALEQRDSGQRDTDEQDGAQPAAIARLVAIVPELRTSRLAPAQQKLLALGLALVREPASVRSKQFAFALKVLEHALVSTGASGDIDPRSNIGRPEPAATESVGARDAAQGVGIADGVVDKSALLPISATPLPQGARRLDAGAKTSSGSFVSRREQGALQEERETGIGNLGSVKNGNDSFPHPYPLPEGEGVFVGVDRLSIASQSPDAIAKPAAENEFPDLFLAPRINTAFGGIFYLLNAALAMQIYSDFTAPRGQNLKLSPWDWLALIGRTWFGREFVRDPVWGLLAGLAGRQQRSLRRPRWFNGQMKLLLDRLALALGEQPESAGPEMRTGAAGKGDSPLNHSHRITALLCRAPAQVEVSASRVDVHLSLSDLALSIRIAGLDRDPGWIPAAGRAVYFHFD